MKIRNKILNLILAVLLLFITPIQSYSQIAKVPINITVNGTLTISDANVDSSSGKNPTLNVNLDVTPDLGAAEVVKDANFRIRTNRSVWILTAQRTLEEDSGPTNITPQDISVLIKTQAGENANSMAGVLVAPFNIKTDLSKIQISNPVNVIVGSSKTSIARDSTNSKNYFQVNTQYGILPDYFYQPGTWKTTITFNLVTP